MVSIRFPKTSAVVRSLAGFVAVLLLSAGTVSAQIPDKFENLKVLPKDIGKRELVDVMRGFAGALGVRCNFCHKGGSDTSLEGMDFATDELEPKRVARTMMQMVGEINNNQLPAIGRKHVMQVTCVTCHRGLEEPHTLADTLERVIERDGVGAAVERYRELRAEYYGKGSYDFGPATLNGLAESLAHTGKGMDGPIELVRLNLEMNPDDATSYLMLGQLLAQSGDKEKAIEAVEHSLKIEPDNNWAKKMLERLKQ